MCGAKTDLIVLLHNLCGCASALFPSKTGKGLPKAFYVKRQFLHNWPMEQLSALVVDDTMAQVLPNGMLAQIMSAPTAAWLRVPVTHVHNERFPCECSSRSLTGKRGSIWNSLTAQVSLLPCACWTRPAAPEASTLAASGTRNANLQRQTSSATNG